MFDQLVGNQRAKDILRRMLTHHRVPGALLFAGDEGLGKKLFALELARAINCRERVGVEGCGVCPACVRIGNFQLPPADDNDANKQIHWSEHRDVGMIRPAGRFIPVDLIRQLERETNFRPYEGAARIFIIDSADRLQESAANALLKTLEEPSASSHLILITSRPASLLPTIRSRCQAIRFAPLAAAEVEKFLVEGRHRSGEEARLAAHLSGGRPGSALDLNLDTYRERRDAMIAVLEAIAVNRDHARLLRAAEELSDAKHKEEYEPRLHVLELLIHDLWLLTLSPDDTAPALVNYDLRERLARMTSGAAHGRAARWLARVEELRRQLLFNVNRRVATDTLFLSMAGD